MSAEHGAEHMLLHSTNERQLHIKHQQTSFFFFFVFKLWNVIIWAVANNPSWSDAWVCDAVTKAEQTRDGWLWSGCSCDPHWINEEWSFRTELGFGMQSSLGRTWQPCFTQITSHCLNQYHQVELILFLILRDVFPPLRNIWMLLTYCLSFPIPIWHGLRLRAIV